MTAIPPSITVIVSSTEVAADRIESSVVMPKSAAVASVMPCRDSSSALASW